MAQHEARDVSPAAVPDTDDAALWLWQRRLLPYMLGALVFLALFFLLASLWVFIDFRSRLSNAAADLGPMFSAYEQTHAKDGAAFTGQYLQLKTAALLEQELISRRYRQANSMVLARIWTRYLGFLTGMILSLLGAFFVLGQLRTGPNTLRAGAEGFKASLATSSPGLVLATLGTLLMAISLWVTFDVNTTDVAVYLQYPERVSRRPPPSLPADSSGPPKAPPDRTPADKLFDDAPSASQPPR